MNLKRALESAGFDVRPDGEGLRAYCCGEEASHDADCGGIFGPTRVYCERCGGEIKRREIDRYGVEQSCRPATTKENPDD